MPYVYKRHFGNGHHTNIQANRNKINIDHGGSTPTENDYCINTQRGIHGTCLAASKCPEVLKDYRNGIKPVICSYLTNEPIVCCPEKKTSSGVDLDDRYTPARKSEQSNYM